MTDPNEKVSSASKPLDSEDAEALRVAGSAYQGTESASPAAGDGQPSPAVNQLSPGAVMWAGHALALCNQFFVSRFGAEGKIPDAVLEPIRNDLALAIDTYLPTVETKPGIFALVALGGHFFACQRERVRNAKQSESSGSQEPERQPFSGGSSEADRAS